MYKVIANWKIDKIVYFLVTSPYKSKIADLEVKVETAIEDIILGLHPREVLDFIAKHPALIRNINTFELRGSVFIENPETGETVQHKINRYISLDVPAPEISVENGNTKSKNLESLNEIIQKHWGEFSSYLKETIILDQDRKTLENKVRCTLSKLKTYDKVKKEFPEAYEILITQIDGEELKEEKTNMCDDVEALRAKLKGGIK